MANDFSTISPFWNQYIQKKLQSHVQQTAFIMASIWLSTNQSSSQQPSNELKLWIKYYQSYIISPAPKRKERDLRGQAQTPSRYGSYKIK
uniref:Uncharacterized protein n=1 Tax=Panagrolaimus sp. ES5 TaxID=591445 RepID=A0AC34GEZ4_9BILA